MDLKKFAKPTRFLLIGLFLYIVWIFLHEGVLKPRGIIDPWLTNIVASSSVTVLNVMDYDVYQVRLKDGNRILNKNETGLLKIAYICDGLELYVIFLIFLVAFPGPWKHKVWFIPTGMLAIYLANLIRVVSLILIQMHFPGYLQFNHKYTFVVLIYAFIFLLWVLWVQKFGLSKTRPETR